MNISAILQEKEKQARQAAEEFKASEHFHDMGYSLGRAYAYRDAIEIMRRVNSTMSEENLRRLLGRFVDDRHVGAIVSNIRANIKHGMKENQQ